MVDSDRLARIWAETLNVKTVKPEDNFFALGGHSLLAVKLIARLREELHFGDELDLPELFDHPTLAGFGARLAALSAGEQGTL